MFPAELPYHPVGGGLQTDMGLLLPSAGRVAAYVRSSGVQSYDPDVFAESLVTTTSAALSRVRSGQGDTVVYLPGHAEDVDSATFMSDLVAGTKLVGLGYGSLRPTFTWTATGAQMAINDANVMMQNLLLKPTGANGVAKAIAVTAAGFHMIGCEVEVATTTDEHMLVGVELGAGAHQARILGNKFRGIVGEPCEDGIHIAAAVNDPEIAHNVMMFAGETGTDHGHIRISAAALRVHVHHNILDNLVAASDHCIVVGDVAATGVIDHNMLAVLTNDAPATFGISLGSSAAVHLFENYCTTNAKVSGALSPAADS